MSADDLQQLVNQDAILTALKTYVGDNEVSILKAQVSKGTDEVEGFMSILLRVSVDFSHNGKVKSKMFIVKRLPMMEVQLKMVTDMNLFSREVLYYDVVVPKFRKVMKSSLPLPSCYLAQSDKVNDLLILEDLKRSGFKTLGLGTNLSVEHCKLVMTELAKLHLASVALEKEIGEKLVDVYPLYNNSTFTESSTTEAIMKEGVNLIVALCQEIPRFQSVSSVLENKLSAVWKQFFELMKPQTDQQNVLCHGDCGVHNIMFIQNKNGEPFDLRFIDLQCTLYASPFTDILYFLYSSTSIDIRKRYVHDLLNAYLTSYNTYAQKCGLSVQPLKFYEVKKNYNSVRLYGVLIGVLSRPIAYLKNEIVPKDYNEGDKKFENMFYGDRTSIAKAKFAKDEEFRKDITGIITELCELYGINT